MSILGYNNVGVMKLIPSLNLILLLFCVSPACSAITGCNVCQYEIGLDQVEISRGLIYTPDPEA